MRIVSRLRKNEPRITCGPSATSVKPIAVAYSWESSPKPPIAQLTKIAGSVEDAREEQEPAAREAVLEPQPAVRPLDEPVGLAEVGRGERAREDPELHDLHAEQDREHEQEERVDLPRAAQDLDRARPRARARRAMPSTSRISPGTKYSQLGL